MTLFELKQFMEGSIVGVITRKDNGWELIYENPNNGEPISEAFTYEEEKEKYIAGETLLWSILDIIGLPHYKHGQYNIKIEIEEKEVA